MALADMFGLPGLTPEQQEALKSQQLLALGASMLQSSAPSTDPRSRSLAFAIGQGLQNMLQARPGAVAQIAQGEALKRIQEQRALEAAVRGETSKIPLTETIDLGDNVQVPYRREQEVPRGLSSLLNDFAMAHIKAGDIKGGVDMAEAQAKLSKAQTGDGKPFDANNEYDAFLAQKAPFDVTTPQGYSQAVRWWSTPQGQTEWQKFREEAKDYKRPGTFQVGMMGGKTYAVQGNPNNQQLEYFEPREKAWKSVPEGMTFTNQLLTPQDAATLGVPYGTTKGDAATQGLSAIPPAKRELLAGFDTALNILGDISQYSKKVNTFGAGPAGLGRAITGTSNWLGGKTQTSPDVTALMNKTGELSLVIRALGEKGALAEGDVNRGLKLIPTEFDTKEVAEQKLRDLSSLFSKNKQATLSALTSPMGAGAKSNQIGRFTVEEE